MEIVTLITNNMNDLNSLKLEISRFFGFRKKQILKTIDRSLLNSKANTKHLNRFSIQIPNQGLDFKRSLEVNKSVVSATLPIETFTLSETFDLLFNENMSTGLCRVFNSQKEVHLSIIKHFWFDSCVTFQVFFNILLAPINGKQWVTENDFLRSIEATHSKNMCRAFVPEKDERKFSSGMRIQQFLCDC